MAQLAFKNLSKLAPFAGGALKFATQILPLLNLGFIQTDFQTFKI